MNKGMARKIRGHGRFVYTLSLPKLLGEELSAMPAVFGFGVRAYLQDKVIEMMPEIRRLAQQAREWNEKEKGEG